MQLDEQEAHRFKPKQLEKDTSMRDLTDIESGKASRFYFGVNHSENGTLKVIQILLRTFWLHGDADLIFASSLCKNLFCVSL